MDKRFYGLIGLALTFMFGLGAMQFNPGTDPCMNPNVHKDSVVFTFSSATATAVVPGSTPVLGVVPQRKIYVCGVYASETGSTPAIQLGYALSTACATPVALTGALSAPFVQINNPGIAAPIASGTPATLCITATGGGVSINGVLMYVQQ